jgi:hypothetical protein
MAYGVAINWAGVIVNSVIAFCYYYTTKERQIRTTKRELRQ